MREEDKLDVLLTQEAGELPPPPVVDEAITPWKRAIYRIVWGIGLTTCTLNVWIVKDLMVAVGTVLLWLGFRALRRENRCFTACWVISLIEAAFQFAGFILNATIWVSEQPLSWLSYSGLMLPLIQYICLWQGIIEVRRRAGQPAEARAAGALIWFYLVLAALALLNVQGLIIVGALLVVYILILRSLSKFAHLLDEAGYQVQPAPVRVSDRSIWITWFAALLVCISAATLLFGRYPMEWTPRPEGEQAGLEEIRSHLVELPGRQWKIIHHFQWQVQPKYRTTECIALKSAAHTGVEGVHMEGTVTGRLLYDKDGTTYLGDYYRLEEEVFATNSIFWSPTEKHLFMALFSIPLGGENCRGYLTYPMSAGENSKILQSWMNYTHQVGFWNYPLMTAEEYEKLGIWRSGSFQTAQASINWISEETEEDPA